MFWRACSVCSAIPPGTIRCVVGFRGICPLAKMNPLARIACEYGPIGAGAADVVTLSRSTLPFIAGQR
jgi:hypothetical protein